MGLGKTVELLACILGNRFQPPIGQQADPVDLIGIAGSNGVIGPMGVTVQGTVSVQPEHPIGTEGCACDTELQWQRPMVAPLDLVDPRDLVDPSQQLQQRKRPRRQGRVPAAAAGRGSDDDDGDDDWRPLKRRGGGNGGGRKPTGSARRRGTQRHGDVQCGTRRRYAQTESSEEIVISEGNEDSEEEETLLERMERTNQAALTDAGVGEGR